MERDEVRRLRGALLAAGYTSDGVVDLLGPGAHAALARMETVPARRATTGGSPLETLVRLFLLQLAVPETYVARALPLDLVVRAGVVTRDGDEVRALLDVRPYAADDVESYVVSDLGTGLDGVTRPLPTDHVLGIGGASTMLAQITVRPEVDRALDLGTGCGVQALHLARHARAVTATDVLPRAIALARLTAGLSGVELDLREGSLLEPVAGERFDLVVSNPPFVVAPDGGARFTYRDSGLPGDEVCRRIIRDAPHHLTDGGWCQLLANWVHRRGEDWRERVGQWLPPGCDAWVVQRDVQDPADYVATWLRDSGDTGAGDTGASDTAAGEASYVERYDAWLASFERAGIEGVGFGFVTLRRTGSSRPAHRVEDWPHAIEQPLGATVQGSFARTRWAADRDDAALLRERLRVAPDVVQETTGAPGAEDPEHLVLRAQRGMRRAERVDTATAALVGACNGEVPLGVLVDAVAALLEHDPAALRSAIAPTVRRLVLDGLLQPA